MAYALLDDQLPDHPKIIAAGPEAAWLYICGLAYCTRLLTDGFIPAAQVYRLTVFERDCVTALVTRLVTVNLWEETDDGYLVHDFAKHNPTAEQVRARREANALRQAKWRQEHMAHLEGTIKEGSNGVSHASPVTPVGRDRNGVTNCVPHPSHSKNLPLPTGEEPDAPAPAMSPSLRAVPKPAKAPPHPALLVAREVLHLGSPDQTQREAITGAVGDGPDALELWRRCCEAWRLAGFNVRNVQGPLDWFTAGGPPEREVRGPPSRSASNGATNVVPYRRPMAESARPLTPEQIKTAAEAAARNHPKLRRQAANGPPERDEEPDGN